MAARKSDRVKRLYRSGKDRILGGVCGGIGEYFKVDPVLIRIFWVVFSLIYGTGLLAYIIAWINIYAPVFSASSNVFFQSKNSKISVLAIINKHVIPIM